MDSGGEGLLLWGAELSCFKANFISNNLFVYRSRACLMSLELEPQIAGRVGTHPLSSPVRKSTF